jgi:hypothetical protein
MLKRSVLSFCIALCALTLGTTARAGAAGDKFLVCHAPPGNPANAHTISVGSRAAVDAHLAHGDSEGACGGVT